MAPLDGTCIQTFNIFTFFLNVSQPSKNCHISYPSHLDSVVKEGQCGYILVTSLPFHGKISMGGLFLFFCYISFIFQIPVSSGIYSTQLNISCFFLHFFSINLIQLDSNLPELLLSGGNGTTRSINYKTITLINSFSKKHPVLGALQYLCFHPGLNPKYALVTCNCFVTVYQFFPFLSVLPYQSYSDH